MPSFYLLGRDVSLTNNTCCIISDFVYLCDDNINLFCKASTCLESLFEYLGFQEHIDFNFYIVSLYCFLGGLGDCSVCKALAT